MKNKTIWMMVDLDNKELPLIVGTIKEVAEYANTSTESVRTSCAHAKERGAKCKFVRIDEEES